MSCFLLPIVVGGAMVLSTVAMAQAPGAKSTSATTIGEGEAIMVSPKTGTVHKSNTKVSAAKHEAAMAKGARELKGAVIYRQGGKLYMMEEPNNETFRDVFDNFWPDDRLMNLLLHRGRRHRDRSAELASMRGKPLN